MIMGNEVLHTVSIKPVLTAKHITHVLKLKTDLFNLSTGHLSLVLGEIIIINTETSS